MKNKTEGGMILAQSQELDRMRDQVTVIKHQVIDNKILAAYIN